MNAMQDNSQEKGMKELGVPENELVCNLKSSINFEGCVFVWNRCCYASSISSTERGVYACCIISIHEIYGYCANFGEFICNTFLTFPGCWGSCLPWHSVCSGASE